MLITLEEILESDFPLTDRDKKFIHLRLKKELHTNIATILGLTHIESKTYQSKIISDYVAFKNTGYTNVYDEISSSVYFSFVPHTIRKRILLLKDGFSLKQVAESEGINKASISTSVSRVLKNFSTYKQIQQINQSNATLQGEISIP